jgi:tetratricopeptide (TPR) repeat protein
MQFRSIQQLYCLLLTAIVAMCATLVVSQRQLAHAATENTDKTGISGIVVPVEGLGSQTQEFVYQYLLGDMAWRRGDLKLASEAMAQAAKISSDKETILRAYNLALEAGRPAIAVEMAEQMLKLETDTVRARAMLLRAHIAGDRPDDVYRELVTLLEQSGTDMDVVVRYVGEALTSVPNAGRWLGVMQRLADRLPDRPEVHLARGFVARRAGQFDQADDSLDRALELQPGWEEAAIFRLSWWNDAGKREAIKTFAEQFLAAYPDRGRFQLVFARLLVQWEDNHAALEQFRHLAEREPANSDALLAAGLLYLQEKQYQPAAEMLRRYLELEPAADQARLYLAQIARKEQRYQAAQEWLSGVYGERYYLEAQLTISRIMADQGRLDEALTHLAEIMPRSAAEQVQIYLAEEQLLRDAGRMDQALTLLNAALVDLPDNPDLLYARGLVTAQLKRLAEHERDMRRLIELQPDNAHAYNALGYTLADQSIRLDEALALINKAIEIQPGDPFILDSLGWVHYRLGNYGLAVGSLKKAFELRSDPEIAAHLGEALWVQGRFQEARDVWDLGLGHEDGAKNLVLQETIRRLVP